MNTIIVYVSFSTYEEAQGVAQSLLEERLVACANIMAPHSALYWWEGKIECAQEVVVIFKTQFELFEKVELRIKDLHSYDVPCIVSWPIEHGHAPFLEWVEKETS